MSWKVTTGGAPAGIAGVSPTIDYRFALDRSAVNRGTNGSATISATVDADGTFVNAGALIQQATTNQLRFDTNPLTLQCRGVLVESQRINRVTSSEGFDSVVWTKSALVTTGSPPWVDTGGRTPSASTNAEKLIPNTSSTGHAVFANTLTATATTATYVASVFAKADGYNWIGLSDAATGQAVYNLTTGANESVDAGITALGAQPYGSGWWRLAISYQATTSNRGLGIDIWNAFPTSSFAGNGSSGVLVWGAQLEQATTLSSYIPTSGTTIQRSADSITINAGLTGTFTMVEKPAGCAVVSGSDIVLQTGYTVERVMSFPVALTNDQITVIRAAM
jgi:hypothetical protein